MSPSPSRARHCLFALTFAFKILQGKATLAYVPPLYLRNKLAHPPLTTKNHHLRANPEKAFVLLSAMSCSLKFLASI
jgi:hypothetical protein